MNCQEVMELMQRYLDRDLGEPEYEAMIEHIRACPQCSVAFERLKRLSDELEHLPKVTPLTNLVDSILPQLEQLDRQAAGERIKTPYAPASAASEAPADSGRTGGERKRTWWRNGSYRALGGVIAAGIVLGLLMVNHLPKADYSAANQESALSSANRFTANDSSAFSEDRASAQENMPLADMDQAAQPSDTSKVPGKMKADVTVRDQRGAGVSDSEQPRLMKNAESAVPPENQRTAPSSENQGAASPSEAPNASADDSKVMNFLMAATPAPAVASPDQAYTAEASRLPDGKQQVVIRDKDGRQVFASSPYEAEQIAHLKWSGDGKKVEFDAVADGISSHVTLDLENKTETRE